MQQNYDELWPGWQTVRLIGRGSYGVVYEIRRKLFDDDAYAETAALKVISIPQNDSVIEEMRSDGYDEESITNTFREHLKNIVAEYSLMKKMSGSTNIVNCDDVRYVQHDDGIGWNIYIKIELLTPLTKAQLPKDEDQVALKLGIDLCRALELCEKNDIIHRNIKPQNIFLSPNGDYKLGDFGIAKIAKSTMGGTKTGTYKYMPPEVFNNKPYGHRADIYSLGLVLYWLLNHRRMPFLPLPPAKISTTDEEKALEYRLKGKAIPAPAMGSPELKRIVLKACAHDPKNRYASAADMREDLEKILHGQVSTNSISLIAWLRQKFRKPKKLPQEKDAAVPASEDEDATVAEDKTVRDPGRTGTTNNPNWWIVPVVTSSITLILIGMQLYRSLGPKGPEPPPENEGPVVIATEAATEAMEAPIETPVEAAKPARDPSRNLLKDDPYISRVIGELNMTGDSADHQLDAQCAQYPAFGSEIPRNKVRSVAFLDTTASAPGDCWDVSQVNDGSVLAWAVPNGDYYDFYIAGEGGVNGKQAAANMFYCFTNLQEIHFNGNLLTGDSVNMTNMFYHCKNLSAIDLSSLDTSAATDMSRMFSGCSNLKSLDLRSFDTSSVISMANMFDSCSGLESLDLSRFDTSSVTDMAYMFAQCSGLKALDLRIFDTAFVKDMSYMFYYCSGLESLNLRSFNTSSVTSMACMFRNCSSVKTLDLSNFGTFSVTNMAYMFRNCSSLETLDVSSFYTSSVKDMTYMFRNCIGLKELDVSHFDLSSATAYTGFEISDGVVTFNVWQ